MITYLYSNKLISTDFYNVESRNALFLIDQLFSHVTHEYLEVLI